MILSPLISNEKNKVSPTGSVVGGSYYSSPGILKPLSAVNANKPKQEPVVQKQAEPVKKQEQSVFKKISESVSSFFSNLSVKSKKLNEMANIKTTTDIGPVSKVSTTNGPKISNSIVSDTSAMITPQKKIEAQKKLEVFQKKLEPITNEFNRLEAKTKTTDKLDWKDRVYKIIDKGEDTPFVGDAVVISKFVPLVKASNRLRMGKGTLEDAQLLQEWLGQENREKTTGYKIMDGLINSATFMAELYASAGSYTVGKELSEKAAKKSVQWLLTKAGKEATEEALQKWGPKLATKVIQGVAGETVRTIVKAPLTVTKGTLENQIKSNIEVIAGVTDTKESISKSITKSFLDSWVENVSERGGDIMGEVVSKISKPLRDKLIKNAMYNTLIKLAPEKSAVITNFFQKAGYDGFIYEIGEERIGDITRGLLYEVGLSDQKFDPKAIKDNFFVELAVLTVPGTVQYGSNAILSKFDKTPNLTNIIMRPDEAVAGVEQFKLNETPDGARILAAAEQAAQEGKSVEIINTDKGLDIRVVKAPVETDPSLETSKTIDPVEARNIVLNSSLENTEVGKKIIKTSLEAEDQGKQIVVSKNIDEIKIVDPVETTSIKDLTLYNGANKEVTETKKTYDNVLVVQTNQAELIKKLADEGNVKAKKLYDSMPDKNRVDFTVADPIIKEAYGDQYDAIQYKNDSPDIKEQGITYYDLSDGKSLAEKRETAIADSLMNRAGKYQETKTQEKQKEVEPTITKNDNLNKSSNTIKDRIDKLIEREKKLTQNMIGSQKESSLKGLGMEYSAIRRQIEGTPTFIEIKNARKYLESRHTGKIIKVDGKEGILTGKMSFGKSEVKFTDGTTKFVAGENIDSNKITDQEVMDYIKKEAIKKLELKERMFNITSEKVQESKKQEEVVKTKEENKPKKTEVEDYLTSEAKKYDNLEDFKQAVMGGKTQYNEYNTELRKKVPAGYTNLTELGIDPEEMVTIYRGIDDISKKVKRKINDGDFVTTDFDSALSYTGDPKDVVEMEVKAKYLYNSEPRDFKEEPFYTGAEYIYTTQETKQLPSEQELIDIWNNVQNQKKDVQPEKQQKIVEKEVTALKKETVSEKVKTSKNMTEVKSALRSVRNEINNLVTEAEAMTTVAKEQRSGLNTKNIAKLKRIYNRSNRFKEGDIETMRDSKWQKLVDSVVEDVQIKRPDLSEEEAFDYALNLPTKADETIIKPDELKQLLVRQKILDGYLTKLEEKAKEITGKEAIEKDNELYNEWKQAVDTQEKLNKLITMSERIEGAKKPVEDTKGKTKLSKVAERVYDQLIGIKDQDISYNPMSIAEDAARASELVQQDESTALRIAKGLELPPPDITETAISIAMAQKALDDGNYDLYSKLIASRTLRQTRRGQEIVAERGRMDENSSEFFMRKLLDERAKIVASGKKWLFDKETKMEQFIKKEVGELKKTIDRKVLNKLESAQKLIDSLTCKI